MRSLLFFVLILALAMPGFAHENLKTEPYRMAEDFGTQTLSVGTLQYYYYVPCPSYSYFWSFSGWDCGDIVGVWFDVGIQGTGGWPAIDPDDCFMLDGFRVLDFEGAGTVYPGLYTVEFSVWCADESGCPAFDVPLWRSGPYETGFGWNYVTPSEPIEINPCNFADNIRILITAEHTGTMCDYPAWGTDAVSLPVLGGCEMHDLGCLPAIYPRPWNGHFGQMHSGYYGNAEPWANCPPMWFCDAYDTTPDCSQYGHLELAWRIYVGCMSGVDPVTEGTTWGEVKSLFR